MGSDTGVYSADTGAYSADTFAYSAATGIYSTNNATGVKTSSEMRS